MSNKKEERDPQVVEKAKADREKRRNTKSDQTDVSQSSEDGANEQERGLTPTLLHSDEAPFQNQFISGQDLNVIDSQTEPGNSKHYKGDGSIRRLLSSIELKVVNPEILKHSLPQYSTDMAAGLDLRACIEKETFLYPGEQMLIPTGVAISIHNPYYVGIIVPRSGKGHKEGLVLSNNVGTIDADYTGEVFIPVYNRKPVAKKKIRYLDAIRTIGESIMVPNEDDFVRIQPGERIAQLLFKPIERPSIHVVEQFSSSTSRSDGGFGHTGKK